MRSLNGTTGYHDKKVIDCYEIRLVSGAYNEFHRGDLRKHPRFGKTVNRAFG